MQKIKILVLMAVVCTVAFSSCKKDSTKPKTTVAAQSISLTFNGTAVSSSTPVALYTKSPSTFLISAGFGGTTAISISINGNIQVGTFDLADGNTTAFYTSGGNSSEVYSGDTGTVVITQLTSTTVTGTFQFTGTSLSSGATGVVTAGKFQANLTTK
jgi:Family of unknown function (DUF6252)